MGRDRNQSGRFDDRIPPAAVLEVFEDRDDLARPLTAGDIVEALGIARRTAHNKLNALVERGELETRKIGARGRVWWTPIPAGEREHTPTHDAQDAVETRREDTADRSPSSAEKPRETTESAEDVLRELDLPGSGGKLDARIDAVLALYEHLQDHAGEPVSRADLLDHVDAGAVGYASRESFWNNFVKANSSQGRDTNALVALPGVEEWGDGEYRYNQ